MSLFHAGRCMRCGAPIYVREEDIAAGDPIAVYSCACFVQKTPATAPKSEGRWQWWEDEFGDAFLVPKGETGLRDNFVGSYYPLGGWYAYHEVGLNSPLAEGDDGKRGLLRALLREGVITEAEATELGLTAAEAAETAETAETTKCRFKWLKDDGLRYVYSLVDSDAEAADPCYGYFAGNIWTSYRGLSAVADGGGCISGPYNRLHDGVKSLLDHKLKISAITEAEYRHLLDTAPKHDKPRN